MGYSLKLCKSLQGIIIIKNGKLITLFIEVLVQYNVYILIERVIAVNMAYLLYILLKYLCV